MKQLSLLKILLFSASLVFLYQAITAATIIPVRFLISFLGQTDDPMKLFSSGMIAIILIFIVSGAIELLYSLGFKKESALISQKRVFAQGIIAFTTVWLTFFTYGVLTAFRVFPGTINADRLLNLYLFWFFFISAFTGRSVKKQMPITDPLLQAKITTLSPDAKILEKNRVTWLSHITGLNKADEFFGKKEDILYAQKPQKVNSGYMLVLIVNMCFLAPVLYMLGAVIFFKIPINPPEAAAAIRFIFSFFFFAAAFGMLGLLGLALSRGVTIYKNCIDLILPTFSDMPLFTTFLPRCCVTLAFDDIVSYTLEKRRRRSSAHYYLVRVKLKMKSGDLIAIRPTMSNADVFEQALIHAIGEKKRVPRKRHAAPSESEQSDQS